MEYLHFNKGEIFDATLIKKVCFYHICIYLVPPITVYHVFYPGRGLYAGGRSQE